MSKQVLIYAPVLHRGYYQLLNNHPNADELLLLGQSFAPEFPEIRKDIRALDPLTIARHIGEDFRQLDIRVVELDEFPQAIWADELVLPAEAMMRELVARFDLGNRIVTHEPTFLRWDREWSKGGRPVHWDGRVTQDVWAQEMMGLAIAESTLSSDWWRQVGAVAVAGGRVLYIAHNQHQPTEYSPYLNGDPRDSFRRGVHIELSTVQHAEAAIVGRAAREGVALEGAEIAVSTFPCPPCSKLIAAAGFTKCYFAGGYSVLDGEDILRDAGVELIWVDIKNPSS